MIVVLYLEGTCNTCHFSLRMMKKRGRRVDARRRSEPATRMSPHSGCTYFPGRFLVIKWNYYFISFFLASLSESSRQSFILPHLSFRFLTSLSVPRWRPFSCVLTEAHETATRIGGNKTVYRRVVQPLAAGIPKIPSEIADGISLQWRTNSSPRLVLSYLCRYYSHVPLYPS